MLQTLIIQHDPLILQNNGEFAQLKSFSIKVIRNEQWGMKYQCCVIDIQQILQNPRLDSDSLW